MTDWSLCPDPGENSMRAHQSRRIGVALPRSTSLQSTAGAASAMAARCRHTPLCLEVKPLCTVCLPVGHADCSGPSDTLLNQHVGS